ncbi:MAG TPA: PAS domain S-box protein [Longimicrobiales bacterium]|nr:PAS domain S-box protein [Longimicrobiales bacterium]
MSDPRAARTAERQQEAGGPACEHDRAPVALAPGLLPLAADPDRLNSLLVGSVQDYAIFALDVEGRVATWTRGAQRIKGYSRDEIIGRHFSIFYPPEAAASGFPQYELDVAAATGRFEDEGWRIRKDGSRFWANVVITALRDEEGTLVGFAKVTRDLTERRRTEQALAESEERFRLLVSSVKDYGIFMLDPQGHIASWNDGAERISGYTPSDIIGRHFSVFYPPEDIEWGKPAWELSVAIAEGRFEDEGWRIRKDGSRFWANVVITPLLNEAGTLLGFAKVTRDLTERRDAERRAIADARRMAEIEAANKAKSEFLAAMSHELRTPLNAIGGYVDLLALGIRGPVTPQQVEDLERIRRSQQHLLGIINDLLNFSRIEAGRVSYDIGPVALHQVLETVQGMIEPQALARGITIVAHDCPPDAVALADRGKVEQILLNLLSNAVKFTSAGGTITLSCAVAADVVALAVQDTGLGISPEKLEAIFEPFVQVGRSLSSPHEGTGLGLAISRDLARAMGGDLGVESVVGVGSTFTLTLPAPPRAG